MGFLLMAVQILIGLGVQNHPVEWNNWFTGAAVVGAATLVLGLYFLLIRPRSRVRFVGCEIGSEVERVDLGSGGPWRTGQRFVPIRAIYSFPSGRFGAGASERASAKITFEGASGLPLGSSIHGRWAGEPQDIESDLPLIGKRTLRSDAGEWLFRSGGWPGSLDIAQMDVSTRRLWAYDASEAWHELQGSAYQVHTTLYVEGRRYIRTHFRLSVPPAGEPTLEVDS